MNEGSFFKPKVNFEHETLYINARIINPSSKYDAKGWLLTKNGKIIDFGSGKFPNKAETLEVIDCAGHVLCPGLLDIQVHFRSPGQEYKEDIETGTKSAAAGGVTTAICMANTTPTIDNAQTLNQLYDKIKEYSYINVLSYASMSKGLNGQELIDMESLKEAGAIGFSDDGKALMNSLYMRRAMEKAKELDLLIAQHAEDINLSDGGCINEGEVSKKLGVKGIPNASEAIIVERDLLLLELVNCRYHVLHISTHQAIDAVRRAKAKGLNVTCEVAPHHFILSDEDVIKNDSLSKMNPPLRVQKDIEAMIEGLVDGTIDAIATDHAPHEPESKCNHISDAAFGIVGLETMLSLSLSLYHQGHMSLSDVLGKMTNQAADIVGIKKGRIAKGADADLVIIDINCEYEIDSSKFSSKSKNTPFNGYKVKGKAIRTIFAGQAVYINKNL